MEPGSEVEVQSRFNGSWVRGFEIVEVRAQSNPTRCGYGADPTARAAHALQS